MLGRCSSSLKKQKRTYKNLHYVHGSFFFSMLLKDLKSYKVSQFHMGLFKKEIIDHPDQNRDASMKYERGDDGKVAFLLASLLLGMGCSNLLGRYWVHQQLRIWGYCPRNCVFAVSLSQPVCLLSFGCLFLA